MLLMPRKNKKKGFTLIELIVVVAILAILAAIAVPSFIGMTAKAKAGVVIANASTIAGAINVFNASEGKATVTSTTKLDYATLSTVTGFAAFLPTISGDTAASHANFDEAGKKVTVDTNGVATVIVN